MRDFGDEALARMDQGAWFHRPSRPTLLTTADHLILLGNPQGAAFDPDKYDVLLFRNKNPGGREMLLDNPNVTSGGGSIPYQNQYANAGVREPDNPGHFIQRLISSSTGDPAQVQLAAYNTTADFGCNCGGGNDIGQTDDTVNHAIVDRAGDGHGDGGGGGHGDTSSGGGTSDIPFQDSRYQQNSGQPIPGSMPTGGGSFGRTVKPGSQGFF